MPNRSNILRRRDSARMALCACVGVFAIVAAVFIAVGFLDDSNADAREPQDFEDDDWVRPPQNWPPVPTPNGPWVPPSTDSIEIEVMREGIVAVMRKYVGDKIIRLYDDPMSPQYKALEWLALVDDFRFETENRRARDEIDLRLVRRFLVVNLWFYFNGEKSWKKKTSWMTNTHECVWYGIRCQDRSGMKSVIEINLLDNGLKGELPPEIAGFDWLEKILLGNNLLYGSIPENFGEINNVKNMGNIKYIALWSNELTGTLPITLGSLTSLERLYLSKNLFTGNIPEAFGNFKNLQQLELNNNFLTGTLPPGIGRLDELKGFLVSNNSLKGNFPLVVMRMESLEVLHLSNNDFDGPIPSSFDFNLPYIQDIRLDRNSFSGCLPEEIFEKKSLKIFHADHNRFSCDLLGLGIYSGHSLEDLRLKHNGIFGVLPAVETIRSSLRILDLSQNRINGAIPPSFGELFYLESLNLSENDLSSTLPNELKFLTRLEEGYFNDNNFEGKIPEYFSRLPMKHLTLHDNKFSGKIPWELRDMGKIEELTFHRNKLVGSVPAALCYYRDDKLVSLTSDCHEPNPEVECKCCSECYGSGT